MSKPVALICSVALEADALLRHMATLETTRVGGRAAYTGGIGGTSAVLVVGGMGKTNAAQALTALLEHRQVRAIVGFGVAGAYPRTALGVGDVALALSDCYADEGVETPSGWISTREIGIPLARSADGDLYNEFPIDRASLRSAEAALRAAGLPFTVGAFATVSCCSGTKARGEQIASLHEAVCETMEGAAYAHVAALYEIPFLGVRGISNLVEDRDLSRWKLTDAAEAAAEAVAHIVPDLPPRAAG